MYIIAGRFKKRRLVTPKGKETRPSLSKVREALFNICQNTIEGALFLDLFAGAGTIGFEALSRGAKCVTFVEGEKRAQRAIEENIASLGVEKETQLIKGNVFKALAHLPPFDIIYADPPYGRGDSTRVAQLIEKHALLKQDGLLYLEDTTDEPFESAYTLVSKRQIGHTILREFANTL